MNVLIASKQPFPYGSAYSTRVRALVEALVHCGHVVTVLGVGDEAGYRATSYSDEHPQISFFGITEKAGVTGSLAEILDFSNAMDHLLCKGECDVVISSSMADMIGVVMSRARKWDVPVILESCEWYHYSSWKYGRLDPRYWLFRFAWNYMFPKADGYIVISKLLFEHYAQYGKPIVRIPTILDVEGCEPQLNLETNIRINLLFAGRFGGTKDDVTPIASAIASDNLLIDSYLLSIVGPSREEVISHNPAIYRKLEEHGALRITGKLPQQEVAEEYRNAAYGCFIRPNRRSSNAGFSTKLGEGMSFGVPFIVNNTGDITEYVKSGVSGVILTEMDEESVVMKLKEIRSLDSDQRRGMRAEARKVAEEYFDWRQYTLALNDLLISVRSVYDV